MRVRSLISALVLATALTHSAVAHEFKSGDLEILHPWARATVPTAKVGGGYLTIVNKGAAADKLLSISSDLTPKAEIHEMSMKDGVMSMKPVEGGIDVPAGGTVALEPGGGHGAGYHVMFMGLDRQLKEGETFKGTLTFEKAGAVPIEFKVEPMGYKGEDHSAHGG